MGIISSLFGGRPRSSQRKETSQWKVAGLVASGIDFVLDDAGVRVLLAGSIVLDSQMQVSFQGGRPSVRGDVVAVVPIASLKAAEDVEAIDDFMKEPMGDMEKGAIRELFRPTIDQLAFAVVREFERQSPAFAKLPG